MIVESLWTLLFGMIGIFVVMGIIALALIVLNKVKVKEENDELE